uniref:Uncharacterized protein n=1 Tax=Plectus sambesii TaxID=2011161 RepID=A0A914VRC8_9BILA
MKDQKSAPPPYPVDKDMRFRLIRNPHNPDSHCQSKCRHGDTLGMDGCAPSLPTGHPLINVAN